MTKLVIIVALIVAIRLSFQLISIPEGYRKIAGASGGLLVEIFRFFQLENILNLVYGFVTYF